MKCPEEPWNLDPLFERTFCCLVRAKEGLNQDTLIETKEMPVKAPSNG